MRLTIAIDLDNDAFQDSRNTEIARILRKLAEDFERELPGSIFGAAPAGIRDINGNTVGTVTIDN